MSATKLKPVPVIEHQAAPPDPLTADELAPVLVAKAEFDQAQAKLTKVREVLRRAKQLGSMAMRAEVDVSRSAAQQLLGESVDVDLVPDKRTVTEEDRLLSVALPELERRERELSQQLLLDQGFLRAAVCRALDAALRRNVASYVEAVDALAGRLTELFALDQLLARFTSASALDPAGLLRQHSKLGAPAAKYLPRGVVPEQFAPVHYLLDGSRLADGPQNAVLWKLTAQLETHVNVDALIRKIV